MTLRTIKVKVGDDFLLYRLYYEHELNKEIFFLSRYFHENVRSVSVFIR